MNAETSDIIAEIAARYLHFGEADLVQALATDRAKLVTDIRALAGSALRQHEEPQTGLGHEISLIDTFAAWGEREARDTAMLIDLCLGAAIEQLVPMTVPSNLWPAEVQITAETLERLAGSHRIVRLQAKPNHWHVRLLPPGEDEAGESNPAWGRITTLRRHLRAFTDFHDANETLAEAADAPESAAWHSNRRRLGRKLISILDDDGRGLHDERPDKLPGEIAPENENADKPESLHFSGSSEKLDSQDGFGENGT